MNRYTQLDILAIILLISVTFVFIVDLLAEHYDRLLPFKWTMGWYAARYIGIICAILLALDTLTN